MLEEFRRRKNLKSYMDKQEEFFKLTQEDDDMDNAVKKVVGQQNVDMHPKEQEPGGADRFFDSNPLQGDTFNPGDFTLMIMDQGSITLVTRLNRINHRRVLIFVGNGKGVIGYATGKGLDHEHAMENAFKVLK